MHVVRADAILSHVHNIQQAKQHHAGDIVPTVAAPTREASDTLNVKHVF